MDGKNTRPAADSTAAGIRARLSSALPWAHLPEALRGLRGAWLAASCLTAVFVLLALIFALFWSALWACVCAAAAIALLGLSNLWFRERVTSPILGLGDTARHIADVAGVVSRQGLNIDAIKRLTGRVPLRENERAPKSCIEFSVRGSLSEVTNRFFIEPKFLPGQINKTSKNITTIPVYYIIVHL